ncbi:MAG: hypothetical protein C4526_00885 [Nitrospiraceae bacterium]|nr:MAG: hypothetical protein C4526_00885 [Nitrospiraceae bacterium]
MDILKSLALIFLIIIIDASVSCAHDLVWPGEKLKALFPAAESFEQKNLYVSDEQRKNIENALGSKLPEEDLQPSIYLAIIRNSPDAPPRKAAAIMFIDAYGKGGKIEMGVVASGKGVLENILIFENNETESIRQSSFLEQFKGKRADDPFITGEDISYPALEGKSAQAIASGAKRGLLIINEMFRKK